LYKQTLWRFLALLGYEKEIMMPIIYWPVPKLHWHLSQMSDWLSGQQIFHAPCWWDISVQARTWSGLWMLQCWTAFGKV
jgi:hypothetical protein